MGSLFGGSKSQRVTSETKLPAWLEQAGEETFDFASDLSRRPYTPYTGARIAPLSGMEVEGVNLLRRSTGAYLPALGTADEFAKAGAQRWDGVWRDEYMNPFIKSALDPAAREIERASERQRLDRNARAVHAGAFGGTRQGVTDVLGEQREREAISDLYGRGYAQAYESGLRGFQEDQRRLQSGADQMMRLGSLYHSLPKADAEALMRGGALKRAEEQASYDLAYGDFLEQRGYPEDRLGLLISSMAGIPTGQKTTGLQPVQQPSMIGQLAGIGMAAAGLGFTPFA